MGIDNLGNFRKEFEKAHLRATKRAARKIGTEIVRERRKRMGTKVSPLRKRAVRRYVARDGTLLVVDHAPMAVAQEFGGEIRSKSGKQLFIKTGEEALASDSVFTLPGGFVVADNGREKRLLGTLRKSVRVRQLERSRRLHFIAEQRFEKYLDEIENNLIFGV